MIRKPVDTLLLLVISGVVLLMPPVIWIFNVQVRIFGIPLVVFYVFGVWLLLALGTAVLSRVLSRPDG
ncbi:MAG: hypothetical protein DHS20C01_09440 [marine bacterium B5-7]|nr:MAG: hypothetical protein DHS20C01_09440 [marine bacterium B5-7]